MTGADPDLTTPTSIVLTTSGGGDWVWDTPRSFVLEAVRSLRATSRHRELEVVVVHDHDTPAATLAALTELGDVDVLLVPFSGPGTAAARRNRGALHASGEVLVFVDDRTQARSDETVGRLVAPLADPTIGMTGAKLVLADGRIDHAGIDIESGRLRRRWRRKPDAVETTDALFVDRDVDGLSGAAVAMRAADFRALGGWSEEAPGDTAGIDLCLKVRREGLRLRWLSDTVLWHFVSGSSVPALTEWELAFLHRRWGRDLRPAPREP